MYATDMGNTSLWTIISPFVAARADRNIVLWKERFHTHEAHITKDYK
jgi:hypothetical protein